MRVRLPAPDTWQDFEKLCQQLWKEIWCDLNAQNNGRLGQPQCGVDVYGKPIYTVDWAGVQCKDKNNREGGLKAAEIETECEKARNFKPTLSSFSLATTAPRDVGMQEYARLLNTQKKYPFDVHIWGWEDIAAEILARPNLLECFYKEYLQFAGGENNTSTISVTAPRDQFKAFFSRPGFALSMGESTRDSIVQLSYELCDNAFLHGKARHVSLSFDGETFSIEDDGVEFNPLNELDSSKASARSHLGSLVFSHFQQEYSGEVDIDYNRVERDGLWKNKLSIRLSLAARERRCPEVLDFQVDLGQVFSRSLAHRYAQSLVIPTGVSEVVLAVGKGLHYSGSFSFIIALRERLPVNVKLTVSHARGDVLFCQGLFDGYDIAFVSR